MLSHKCSVASYISPLVHYFLWIHPDEIYLPLKEYLLWVVYWHWSQNIRLGPCFALCIWIATQYKIHFVFNRVGLDIRFGLLSGRIPDIEFIRSDNGYWIIPAWCRMLNLFGRIQDIELIRSDIEYWIYPVWYRILNLSGRIPDI